MKYGPEKILPYNNEEQKSTQVRRMFDSIAGTYDLLNHALSFGIDKGWRRKGIKFLKPYAPKEILDIATGTGDLAISMYHKLMPAKIIGADISEGMMDVGRKKVESAGLAGRISFEQQDCVNLSYSDNSFDAVTAAFGVRNFEDIRKGISEMYRVLPSRRTCDDSGIIYPFGVSDETTLPDIFKHCDSINRSLPF